MSSGNQDSTRSHHKTLEQKLSILLQNQNQTDAFQSNDAIGRNVMGQEKFSTNLGCGKQCLCMNESHHNTVPPAHHVLGGSAQKEGVLFLAGGTDDLHCGALALFSVPAVFSCHPK